MTNPDDVLGPRSHELLGVRIRFNSRVARRLTFWTSGRDGKRGMPTITLRRTIYTEGSSITRRSFRHELRHLQQWAQYGMWKFPFKYIAESVRKGYRDNRFEVEARHYAESSTQEQR